VTLLVIYILLDILQFSEKTENLLVLFYNACFNYRLAIGVHC